MKSAYFFKQLRPPVVSGIYLAAGFSFLQFVTLRSYRNIFVFGTTVILGYFLPAYAKQQELPHENSASSHTAQPIPCFVMLLFSENYGLNRIVAVFLRSEYCAGLIIGALLDNVIPGA